MVSVGSSGITEGVPVPWCSNSSWVVGDWWILLCLVLVGVSRSELCDEVSDKLSSDKTMKNIESTLSLPIPLGRLLLRRISKFSEFFKYDGIYNTSKAPTRQIIKIILRCAAISERCAVVQKLGENGVTEISVMQWVFCWLE